MKSDCDFLEQLSIGQPPDARLGKILLRYRELTAEILAMISKGRRHSDPAIVELESELDVLKNELVDAIGKEQTCNYGH